MWIGQKIISLRKSKGISQELLAENAGVSLRTIQRIEKGTSIPRPHTLKIVADVLEVSIEELSNVEINEPNAPAQDHEVAILQLVNLSALVVLILPFSNIVLPFIIWKKHKTLLAVNVIGRRIISFQILWTLSVLFMLPLALFLQYSLTNSVAIGHFPPPIFPVYFLLVIINCVTLIRAAILLKRDISGAYAFVPSLF